MTWDDLLIAWTGWTDYQRRLKEAQDHRPA